MSEITLQPVRFTKITLPVGVLLTIYFINPNLPPAPFLLMPLQPKFELQQDEDYLEVQIKVPYVRVSDMEFHVEGKEFHFWCKPVMRF